jgi:triphosphoribosyl-dephospho-CoA synthase
MERSIGFMMEEVSIGIAEHVSACLQLAILLEASAYPQPGNVHRIADFQETKYEHYLASAVAVAPHFRFASHRGILTFTKKISPNNIGIGKIIKNCVKSVDAWQHGGNTLLGTIILLAPIAVAAGMTFSQKPFSVIKLRKNIKTVVETSTSLDAVNVYDAIQIAKPEGLGKAPKLDVTDPDSKKNILEDNVTLFEVFKIAAKYDSVAAEWINNYPATFDLGYPFFVEKLRETGNVNIATVYMFLKILSEIPDTFIARKVGLPRAKEVSAQAKRVLEMGDLTTSKGRQVLWKFDEELRDSEHKLNPGTTADIVTAVLAINILNGFRP